MAKEWHWVRLHHQLQLCWGSFKDMVVYYFNPTREYYSESIERFLEGQAFLRTYAFVFPPSNLSRQQFISLSQSSCMSPVDLTDGRSGGGDGRETNHTTTRKPGPPSINHQILSAASVWFLTETHAHGLSFGNPPPPDTFRELSLPLCSPLLATQKEERPGEREAWWPMRPKSYEGAGMGIGANLDECPERGIIQSSSIATAAEGCGVDDINELWRHYTL